MLKWKSFRFATVEKGDEPLKEALSGMSGKNRVVKFITGDRVDDAYLRVYRDAEQFVDLESSIPTDYYPLVPVDIPLADGQLCKVGFYNKNATLTTPDFAIGYEETG